ncbi:hypothetical protein BDZ45DRAFT_672066 [Acephala macrosclerotiorum]|nr:hypothetical protein BDZ45DRAFT_672066 [Acephala macrosclerotiorum]
MPTSNSTLQTSTHSANLTWHSLQMDAHPPSPTWIGTRLSNRQDKHCLKMARESRPKTDNGKPAPNFERIRGYKVSRRGEEKYPSPQPLKVIRPKPPLLPLREEQECIVPIVMPSFDKPLSSLAESSQGLLRGTSQQLLEPKLIEAPTSLKVVMNTPTRPPMPKTPDSAKSGMGMDSQEDSKGKGKGKAIDEGPQVAYARSAHQRSDSADTKQPTAECERGRPRARKQRAQSNPINRSDSWVLRRGRRSFRSSLDEARTLRSNASTGGHVRVFLKSITNEIELEDGGRLSNIYKDQEELRERILDNHLDIIISELSRRPMPQTIDDLHMNRRLNRNIGKWIKQGVPVRLHDARELKYVSAIQWTLGIEATMSGALAVIEDDGDVKLTLAEKIKLKVKYNRFSRKLRQMDDDPPVSDCPTAQVDRKMCQDRRLRGKRGRDGKC